MDRTKGIGGTDIAAIIGLKPFGRTAYDVWLEKTGRLDGQPDKKEFVIGRKLEPVVLDMIWESMGKPARWFPGEVINKTRPWQVVHLDGTVAEKTIIEAKTAGAYNAHKFGEEGSDDVPPQYITQCTWYMSAMDWDQAVLGVLIGGSDFKTYRLWRDKTLEDFLLQSAETFWFKCVKADTPPPVEASPALERYIKERFPADRQVMRPATEKEVHLIERYKVNLEAFDKIEQIKETYKAELKLAIGEAAGIEGEFGRVTWRKAKSSMKVDWESLAKSQIDAEKLEQLLSKYQTTTEGSRRFLTNLK